MAALVSIFRALPCAIPEDPGAAPPIQHQPSATTVAPVNTETGLNYVHQARAPPSRRQRDRQSTPPCVAATLNRRESTVQPEFHPLCVSDFL